MLVPGIRDKQDCATARRCATEHCSRGRRRCGGGGWRGRGGGVGHGGSGGRGRAGAARGRRGRVAGRRRRRLAGGRSLRSGIFLYMPLPPHLLNESEWLVSLASSLVLELDRGSALWRAWPCRTWFVRRCTTHRHWRAASQACGTLVTRGARGAGWTRASKAVVRGAAGRYEGERAQCQERAGGGCQAPDALPLPATQPSLGPCPGVSGRFGALASVGKRRAPVSSAKYVSPYLLRSNTNLLQATRWEHAIIAPPAWVCRPDSCDRMGVERGCTREGGARARRDAARRRRWQSASE